MLTKPLIAVAFTAVALLAQAQTQTQPATPQGPAFTIKQVGKGVYAAISARAGGNSGFIIGDDGVLVVDTFINQAPARDLLGEIRSSRICPSNTWSTPTIISITSPGTRSSPKLEQPSLPSATRGPGCGQKT